MRGTGAALQIRLLGDLDLRSGDSPLPVPESARAGSLLAYLLLNRHAAQQRQRIAFLLWPDSTEAQARTNLRHVLHNLRRGLADADRYLEVTARTLRWRTEEACWLDVAAFEEAADRAERAGGDDPAAVPALREAVDLYRGDLLEGSYEEWLDADRQRLRGRFLVALRQLATLLDRQGDDAGAIRYAERLLRHDPLSEETYRQLMRLYDARGDRARAVRVYHACATTLEHELGAQPSEETTRQYAALLAPDVAGPPRVAGPPLIGRAAERTGLVDAWRSAVAGTAGLVLVTGEPGIGKTRLLEEFRSWCARHDTLTAAAGAYAVEGGLAYGLIVSWLRADPLAGRLRQLPAGQLTELARLLPELLADLPDLPRPGPLPEAELRQRLFDAVARAIVVPGATVLLVADDVQWSDQESLRFLHYLLRVRADARLLVVAGARREDLADGHPLTDLVAALTVSGRVTELALQRFSPAETAALAHRLTGGDWDETDRARLYGETEGNPLFVIEALRAGWPGGGLTPKVQAVIEARLGQLSAPARDLVGVAATIGRDFTLDVLAAAGDADEDALVHGLDELWRRGIVREQGVEEYDFTHGRLRDVVYRSLTPARRRRNHLRIAAALHRRPAADPGQLALHYERGGDTATAVDSYARAAEAAQALYAHADALRLLDHALELLRTLPGGPERDGRELALLTALAAPLSVQESFASPRMATLQERALRLSDALDTEPSPRMLRFLAVASLTRGDFGRARQIGAELRMLGGDAVLAVEAEYVLGIAEFWQGRFEAARDHFQAALDRYRPEQVGTHLVSYGLDPRVVCMSRLANTLCVLGDPAGAVRARDAALATAAEIAHPASRSTAEFFAAVLSLDLRDTAALRRHVADIGVAPPGQDSAAARLGADVLAGYVDVLDGRPARGLARIQRPLSGISSVDPAPGARSTCLRILVAACAAAGDPRAGLAAADRALAAGDGVSTWESEIRRHRAEFLAALGAPVAEVAAEAGRALAVARRQHAHLYALRAATTVLRTAADGPSRDQLAEVLAGLDAMRGTPDHDDARRLLDPSAKRHGERSRNAASRTL